MKPCSMVLDVRETIFLKKKFPSNIAELSSRPSQPSPFPKVILAKIEYTTPKLTPILKMER